MFPWHIDIRSTGIVCSEPRLQWRHVIHHGQVPSETWVITHSVLRYYFVTVCIQKSITKCLQPLYIQLYVAPYEVITIVWAAIVYICSSATGHLGCFIFGILWIALLWTSENVLLKSSALGGVKRWSCANFLMAVVFSKAPFIPTACHSLISLHSPGHAFLWSSLSGLT